MNSSPSRRPGGRSAQVQLQVRQALEELVTELGRERVTVPLVAERAGVSASSIYRRWGDLSGLLADTALQRLDPDRPLRDTGSLAGDLQSWAEEFSAHLCQPCHRSLLKAAAALDTEEDSDCLMRRRQEAGTLVDRACQRGESPPSTDQVIDHLIAPIVFRLIFGGPGYSPPAVARLVAELLRLHPA